MCFYAYKMFGARKEALDIGEDWYYNFLFNSFSRLKGMEI